MNKAEISKLIKKMKHHFPAFQVPVEDDKLLAMINDIHEELTDTPYETALENFRRYCESGPQFAPSIPILKKPLDTDQDRYHSGLKISGQEYLTHYADMERTAGPPSDEIRRIIGLPQSDRLEAIKQYAVRKQQSLPIF